MAIKDRLKDIVYQLKKNGDFSYLSDENLIEYVQSIYDAAINSSSDIEGIILPTTIFGVSVTWNGTIASMQKSTASLEDDFADNIVPKFDHSIPTNAFETNGNIFQTNNEFFVIR